MQGAGHGGISVYRPLRRESDAVFLPAPLLFGHVVSASAGAARRVRIPHYRAYRASRAEQGRPMRYAGHGGISVYRLVRHESDAVFLPASIAVRSSSERICGVARLQWAVFFEQFTVCLNFIVFLLIFKICTTSSNNGAAGFRQIGVGQFFESV